MYSEIDLDTNEKALASTRINPAIYGKYIVIPKRAVGDPNLNKNPVLFQILVTLCSFASNKRHRLFVSQAHLSKKLMKHQSTISRQIKMLVKMGYLKVLRKGSPLIKFNQKSTHYIVLF